MIVQNVKEMLNVKHVKLKLSQSINIVKNVTSTVPPVVKKENVIPVKLNLKNTQKLDHVDNVLIKKEIVKLVKLISKLDVKLALLNILPMILKSVY